MKHIKEYLIRLNIKNHPVANHEFLLQLHRAHLYSIPFENFQMKRNSFDLLSYKEIAERIIIKKRGGICFEFSVLIKSLFDYMGYHYSFRLARSLVPFIAPATHQIFIVTIDDNKWIFDIGYGARGPRSPLMLMDGYTHNHPFLSSKVSRHHRYGWVISIKENSKHNAVWEDIYAFHDIETFEQDIYMAYFYTLHSPNSLLNTNIVASLPNENGRISIRNNMLTEIKGYTSSHIEITDEKMMKNLLLEKFGIDSLLTE